MFFVFIQLNCYQMLVK
uniref:Uncharacterized protein n=1 Tax=Arundo donax TaxID=35708 RepID=A0A0A9B7C9_ARUDO